MKKITRVLSALSLMVLGIAVCSCSKSEVAKSIPADSDLIVRANLVDLVMNSGGEISKNGEVILNADVEEVFKSSLGSKVLNSTLAVAEGLDLSQCYLVVKGADRHHFEEGAIGVVAVRDKKSLGKSLKQVYGSQRKRGDFEVFEDDDDVVLAIKGSVLYVSSEMSVIDRFCRDAEQENIAENKHLMEMLTADHTLCAVMKCKLLCDKGDLPSRFRHNLICQTAKLSGQRLTGELWMEDADGARIQWAKDIKPLDTSLANLLPTDCNLMLACGNVEDTNMREKIDRLGYDVRPFDELVTGVNGTTAFAIALPSNITPKDLYDDARYDDLLLNRGKLLLMSQYDASTVTSALESLKKTMAKNGEIVPYGSRGFICETDNHGENITLYVAEKNKFFAMANYALPGDGGRGVPVEKLSGKRAAMWLHLAPTRTLQPMGLDFGFDALLTLTEDTLEFEASINGTQSNFLAAWVDFATNSKLSESYENYRQDKYYEWFSYGGECDEALEVVEEAWD